MGQRGCLGVRIQDVCLSYSAASELGQVFESHIDDFPHRDVLDVFPNPEKHCCRALSVMSACTRGHGHQFDGFFDELEDQGAFFFPCCEIHALDMSLAI
jgi:hypothetical protein